MCWNMLLLPPMHLNFSWFTKRSRSKKRPLKENFPSFLYFLGKTNSLYAMHTNIAISLHWVILLLLLSTTPWLYHTYENAWLSMWKFLWRTLLILWLYVWRNKRWLQKNDIMSNLNAPSQLYASISL